MTLAILCPGQGDQTPGMLDLLRGSPGAKPLLHVLADVIGHDPLTLPPDRCHANAIAQPLVCTIALAAFALLRDHIPEPAVFAGYSVGELAAHGCAGALAPEAVVRLARQRAELMDAASAEPGGLCAVRGLGRAALAALCGQTGCFIAIVNGEDRFIAGGRAADLAALDRAVEAEGGKVTHLSIAVASHTPLMEPAREPFRARLLEAAWQTPSAPVLAGVSGAAVRNRAKAIEALAIQIDHPLDWAACLDALDERRCTVLLELGPGSGLSRMARERLPHLQARAVCEFASISGVASWVRQHLDDAVE
ncbi:acyltransferase domain-containing protein [Xanthobacter oligotrophicus]|uniref:Acyltransferase domain-containing protein n=1 Tax=Xanthobacter oligotrophicus TaxID=2607286 RepID=A0ABW6ZUU1_9HYPH